MGGRGKSFAGFDPRIKAKPVQFSIVLMVSGSHNFSTHVSGPSKFPRPPPTCGPIAGTQMRKLRWERGPAPPSCTQFIAPNHFLPPGKADDCSVSQELEGEPLGRGPLRDASVHGLQCSLQCLHTDACLTPGGPELVRAYKMRIIIVPPPGV